MAGMEWEGEVSCVKENLVYSRQRKPFAHRCTVHRDQQTPTSLGSYRAALMLCFTLLVSVVTMDTQYLIPSSPRLSPKFFLLDKAFPSHPNLRSTPGFSFKTLPLYQKHFAHTHQCPNQSPKDSPIIFILLSLWS